MNEQLTLTEDITTVWATSYEQLAGLTGVDKKVLKHLQKRPDAPQKATNGSYRVDRWIDFLAHLKEAEGGKGLCDCTTADDDKSLLTKMKVKKLKIETEAAKLKLEETKQTLIRRDVVEAFWAEKFGKIRAITKSMFEDLQCDARAQLAEWEKRVAGS